MHHKLNKQEFSWLNYQSWRFDLTWYEIQYKDYYICKERMDLSKNIDELVEECCEDD